MTVDEVAVRDLLGTFARAIHDKDAAGAIATLADDVVAFDLAPPLRIATYAPDTLSFDCNAHLQFKGAKALRKHLEACMPCMQTSMSFEIHGLGMAAHGDVAFCHYLARYGATGLRGEEHAGWPRVTVCLHKVRDEWLIAHDHCSVPFDMESGKALLGLEP
jgi:ketosteroid isomerase-like protein